MWRDKDQGMPLFSGLGSSDISREVPSTSNTWGYIIVHISFIFQYILVLSLSKMVFLTSANITSKFSNLMVVIWHSVPPKLKFNIFGWLICKERAICIEAHFRRKLKLHAERDREVAEIWANYY